jgi:hypothetical protein
MIRHPHPPTSRFAVGAASALALTITAAVSLGGASGASAAAVAPCRPLPAFDASNFAHEGREPAAIDNRYFPLEPGTTFVYRGTKDGDPVRNVTLVTDRVKMIHIDGRTIPAVQVLDRVYVAGALEERTLDWYAQDRQGNVWYMGEQSRDVATGDTSGSWEAGVGGARPGVIMPAHPKGAGSYMQEFAPDQGAQDRAAVAGFVHTVSVPYGTFHRVLKTQEGSCVEVGDEWKFYAPGVGNIEVRSLGDDGKPDGVEEQHLVKVVHREVDDDRHDS